MKLHTDKKVFEQAVEAAAQYCGVPAGIIEKDYYVTLLLKKIAQSEPQLVFKGGTSLSKCYKLIKRFSEDIDLTLSCTSQSLRVNLTHNIKDICKNEGLPIVNGDQILSKNRFNRYIIDYKPVYSISGLNPYVIVETAFMQRAFPVEEKQAASLIYDFMLDNGFADIIAGYDLAPFTVKVQTLARTLIDKVFAICDYYLKGETERYSRHLYDIAEIVKKVPLDDSLRRLAQEVGAERGKNPINKSAAEGVNIPELLKRILDERYFEADYKNVTKYLLYEDVDYETAARGLQAILQMKIFG